MPNHRKKNIPTQVVTMGTKIPVPLLTPEKEYSRFKQELTVLLYLPTVLQDSVAGLAGR